jgi:gamma-glutamyltranspeptidase / glutathione hydrolase
MQTLHIICCILVGTILHATPPILSNKAIHHPIASTTGMVASQEAQATQIGIDILKQGGNAIDAAVAVGFSLAVTLPKAGNLGGGGFMLIHIASENKTVALDFRETAPLRAHKDMFLNTDNSVNTTSSRFSVLASGVPGTVHGLLSALKTYGSLPRKTVIAPAYNLAKHGQTVSPYLHASLTQAASRLQKHPETNRTYFPNNQAPNIGTTWKQQDLARTLKRIIQNGIPGFYSGPTAEKIHTFMQEQNGSITKQDLKNYTSIWRKPIATRYKKHTIYTMPLPSSAGITMHHILKLMEPYPIQKWGPNSANTMHIMSEAMSLAYADRAQWLGDSDHVTVPVKQLLSQKYIKTRARRINPHHHTPSQKVTFGNPIESNETTHYSIVDPWGNAVSVTTTLNFSYGSGITVPGTGILLNNEMDDFSAKPGVPNAYGLLGNKKNAIAPNKRMLSSMSPTIVLKNNQLYIVTGTPGGSRIITTTVQLLSHLIDHNMNVAEATHMPRFHHQWFPDHIRIEQHGFSNDTLHKLRKRGHAIVTSPAMGGTQTIVTKDGYLFGASDPRKPESLTLGY